MEVGEVKLWTKSYEYTTSTIVSSVSIAVTIAPMMSIEVTREVTNVLETKSYLCTVVVTKNRRATNLQYLADRSNFMSVVVDVYLD